MNDLAYIALGSNLGERLDYLQMGLDSLRSLPAIELVAASSIYETEPQGYTQQPTFLNAVCSVRSALSPLELLTAMQAIEKDHKRQRHIHWGPRTLDLDLLLYGKRQLDSDLLVLPHPYMTERDFVLAPLCQIAPQLRNPLNDRLYADYLHHLKNPPLRTVAEFTISAIHADS